MDAAISRRMVRRSTRRAELIDAALSVFVHKGVAATSVDDIVRAAGIAKGTFYLYFATKDEVVNAVAERMVDGVADRVEALAGAHDRSPVERLLALGEALREVGDERYERDLIEIVHRRENRAIHDRMSEGVLARMAPFLTRVISDGVAAECFAHQNPRHAAAFVLGALNALHDVVSRPEELEKATRELNVFMLRGLGYVGEIEP